MPFNDYWSVTPALTDLSLTPFLIGAAGAVLLAVGGPLFGPGWLCLAGLLGLAVVAVLAYRKVMDTAQVPFPVSPPPAPGPDLPTVLKALYLQRAFTDFAIRTQGLSDQAVAMRSPASLPSTSRTIPARQRSRPASSAFEAEA